MIDGQFIAYEYRFALGDRIFKGLCADVTKDTKFDGLGDSREDQMSAFAIIMACGSGHEFTGGDMDMQYRKYRISLDRGESWQHQNRKFKIDGNKIVLINNITKQDCPESETGLMTFDGDTLTVTNANPNGEVKVVYKKVSLPKSPA